MNGCDEQVDTVRPEAGLETPIPQIQETVAGTRPGVLMQVIEDERAVTKDNNFSGEFHINEIPPAPRDVPGPENVEEVVEVVKLVPPKTSATTHCRTSSTNHGGNHRNHEGRVPGTCI